MVQLQARCRGYLVRQQVQAKKKAVVVIQAHARGMAARRNFQQRKATVGGHQPVKQVGMTRGKWERANGKNEQKRKALTRTLLGKS
jgi:myosin heavy subunit